MKEVSFNFNEVRMKRENLTEEQLNEFLLSHTAALGGVVKTLIGMMGIGNNFGVPVNIKGSTKDVSAFTRALKGERRYMDAVKNFGLNKRDLKIAEFLIEAKNKFGYPQQINTYFDKHLSPTVKESALLLGDMNRGGLQLASQSFNEDSLKAVKRRNISDEEMKTAVEWAHSNGLKTESELIFGLPYETKKSFLDALEFIMKIKTDTIAAHNLFLLKGIELNRKEERKHFKL